MQTSSLIVYGHPGSQPARAVLMYLALLGEKYELKLIDFLNGENRSEEFAKINPIKLIPAIQEGDYFLAESQAILVYLALTRKDTKYYPTDPKALGKVHMYLSWHHSNTRACVDLYFVTCYKKAFPKKTITATVDEGLQKMEDSSRRFEEIFLKNSKFVAGDSLTIADLMAFTEYQQVAITTGYDFGKNFPLISKWMQEVSSIPELKDFDKAPKEFLEKFQDIMAKPSL